MTYRFTLRAGAFHAGWLAGCLDVDDCPAPEGEREAWLEGYRMAKETAFPLRALLPEIQVGNFELRVEKEGEE